MIDPLIYSFLAENLHREVCLINGESARARGFDVTRKISMNMYMKLDDHGELSKHLGSDLPSKKLGEGFTDMWIRRCDSGDAISAGVPFRPPGRSLGAGEEWARKPSDPE